MTTVSGISSTPSPSVSPTMTAANTAMGLLLQSADVMSTLPAPASQSQTKTMLKITSAMWGLLDPKNKSTITKADVQNAITKLGSTATVANGLWAQLDPNNTGLVSKADFALNTYVSGTATASLSSLQTAATANNALNSVLNSADITQALSTNATKWTPPTQAQTLSLLWAAFNLKGSHTITKADVQKAIANYGGKAVDVNTLWSQMDPNKKGYLNAGDFSQNAYLRGAIAADQSTIQTNVSDYLQYQGPAASDGVLGGFLSVGGAGSIVSEDNSSGGAASLFSLLA